MSTTATESSPERVGQKLEIQEYHIHSTGSELDHCTEQRRNERIEMSVPTADLVSSGIPNEDTIGHTTACDEQDALGVPACPVDHDMQDSGKEEANGSVPADLGEGNDMQDSGKEEANGSVPADLGEGKDSSGRDEEDRDDQGHCVPAGSLDSVMENAFPGDISSSQNRMDSPEKENEDTVMEAVIEEHSDNPMLSPVVPSDSPFNYPPQDKLMATNSESSETLSLENNEYGMPPSVLFDEVLMDEEEEEVAEKYCIDKVAAQGQIAGKQRPCPKSKKKRYSGLELREKLLEHCGKFDVSTVDVLQDRHLTLCKKTCTYKHHPLTLALGITRHKHGMPHGRGITLSSVAILRSMETWWDKDTNVPDPCPVFRLPAVHLAFVFGRVEELKLLLRMGLNACRTLEATYESAIHTASRLMYKALCCHTNTQRIEKFKGCLNILTEADPRVLLTADKTSKNTALHAAATRMKELCTQAKTTYVNIGRSAAVGNEEDMSSTEIQGAVCETVDCLLEERDLQEHMFRVLVNRFHALGHHLEISKGEVANVLNSENKHRQTVLGILEGMEREKKEVNALRRAKGGKEKDGKTWSKNDLKASSNNASKQKDGSKSDDGHEVPSNKPEVKMQNSSAQPVSTQAFGSKEKPSEAVDGAEKAKIIIKPDADDDRPDHTLLCPSSCRSSHHPYTIMAARARTRPEIIKTLEETPLNKDKAESTVQDPIGQYRYPLIHLACIFANEELLKYLLEEVKCSPLIYCPDTGTTPLSMLIVKMDMRTTIPRTFDDYRGSFTLLIENNFRVLFTRDRESKKTVFHVALERLLTAVRYKARSMYVNVLSYLLKCLYDLYKRDVVTFKGVAGIFNTPDANDITLIQCFSENMNDKKLPVEIARCLSLFKPLDVMKEIELGIPEHIKATIDRERAGSNQSPSNKTPLDTSKEKPLSETSTAKTSKQASPTSSAKGKSLDTSHMTSKQASPSSSSKGKSLGTPHMTSKQASPPSSSKGKSLDTSHKTSKQASPVSPFKGKSLDTSHMPDTLGDMAKRRSTRSTTAVSCSAPTPVAELTTAKKRRGRPPKAESSTKFQAKVTRRKSTRRGPTHEQLSDKPPPQVSTAEPMVVPTPVNESTLSSDDEGVDPSYDPHNDAQKSSKQKRRTLRSERKSTRTPSMEEKRKEVHETSDSPPRPKRFKPDDNLSLSAVANSVAEKLQAPSGESIGGLPVSEPSTTSASQSRDWTHLPRLPPQLLRSDKHTSLCRENCMSIHHPVLLGLCATTTYKLYGYPSLMDKRVFLFLEYLDTIGWKPTDVVPDDNEDLRYPLVFLAAMLGRWRALLHLTHKNYNPAIYANKRSQSILHVILKHLYQGADDFGKSVIQKVDTVKTIIELIGAVSPLREIVKKVDAEGNTAFHAALRYRNAYTGRKHTFYSDGLRALGRAVLKDCTKDSALHDIPVILAMKNNEGKTCAQMLSFAERGQILEILGLESWNEVRAQYLAVQAVAGVPPVESINPQPRKHTARKSATPRVQETQGQFDAPAVVIKIEPASPSIKEVQTNEPAVDAEPLPESEVQQIAEGVPEPLSDTVVHQTAEGVPEPLSDTEVQQTAEEISEPLPDTEGQQTAEGIPQSLPDTEGQQTAEGVPEPLPDTEGQQTPDTSGIPPAIGTTLQQSPLLNTPQSRGSRSLWLTQSEATQNEQRPPSQDRVASDTFQGLHIADDVMGSPAATREAGLEQATYPHLPLPHHPGFTPNPVPPSCVPYCVPGYTNTRTIAPMNSARSTPTVGSAEPYPAPQSSDRSTPMLVDSPDLEASSSTQCPSSSGVAAPGRSGSNHPTNGSSEDQEPVENLVDISTLNLSLMSSPTRNKILDVLQEETCSHLSNAKQKSILAKDNLEIEKNKFLDMSGKLSVLSGEVEKLKELMAQCQKDMDRLRAETIKCAEHESKLSERLALLHAAQTQS